MATPLDTIVVTDGNREAFERVIGVTREHGAPERLFVVGPRGTGKTSLLRALMTHEKGAYFKIYRRGRKDAVAYAEDNCTKYLNFQAHWPVIASRSWQNEGMYRLLRGEGMLNPAVAARMAERNGGPAVPVMASDTGIDDSNQANPPVAPVAPAYDDHETAGA